MDEKLIGRAATKLWSLISHIEQTEEEAVILADCVWAITQLAQDPDFQSLAHQANLENVYHAAEQASREWS